MKTGKRTSKVVKDRLEELTQQISYRRKELARRQESAKWAENLLRSLELELEELKKEQQEN